MFGVFLQVLERLSGYSCLHRRLGNGGCDPEQGPRIKRGRDQIGGPELEALYSIGSQYPIGHLLLSQIGNCPDCGNLHLGIDFRSPDIEGSAEQKRKAEYVVDLIVVIASTGCHDTVRPRLDRFGVGYFRFWIGHGEDDRFGRHGFYHILGQHAGGADPAEQIRSHQCLPQVPVRSIVGKPLFIGIHRFGPPPVDCSLGVAHDQVLFGQSERYKHLSTGNTCGPGTIEHRF